MNRAPLLILLLVLAFGGFTAYSQTYSQPGELPVERVSRRAFPKFFGRGHPAMSPESFFPIGWSRDGKFAYYIEPVDEACGCYYALLVIQDMRTDKRIWEFKYDQSDEADPQTGDMRGPGNLAELWKKNQKLFSEKLTENGIIAGRSTLLANVFTAAGGSFTAKLVKRMGKNPDDYEDRVNLYTVSLTSAKRGTKKVYTSEDHTKEEYWFMLDSGLIGAIKSPYEDRVAIIALEVKRGYEGPPHTGDLVIVGADLTSGFGKK